MKSKKLKLVLVVALLAVTLAYAQTTEYFIRTNEMGGTPPDTAYVSYEAYSLQATVPPENAPPGFVKVGGDTWFTGDNMTPLDAYNHALGQGQTDDHNPTPWRYSTFIYTTTGGSWKKVYVGSHTLINSGGEKYIWVSDSTRQDSLKRKVLRSYGLTGVTVRFVAEIVYPQDSSHRWDVFGSHIYISGPAQTSYYGLRY